MLEPIKELEFLEDKHYYKVNGRFIPSVSSVIRPIAKQIYGDIDEAVLKRAADRGTDVHFAIEVYETTGAEIISDEHKGYFDGYKLFKTEHPNLEAVAIEYRVYDPVLWYAGTADIIFRDAADGGLILNDTKTSFGIEMCTVVPQLTGYENALKRHGINVKEVRVLHLRPGGTYEWKRIEPDLDIFISCLAIQNHIKKYKQGA